mmetsp:Transcript_18960/g.27459  ORF Transcript_18960/g.27459 Transcript_18960/m.27459 type:complete len:105 (-) Transcript_18960:758-1072(-)
MHKDIYRCVRTQQADKSTVRKLLADRDSEYLYIYNKLSWNSWSNVAQFPRSGELPDELLLMETSPISTVELLLAKSFLHSFPSAHPPAGDDCSRSSDTSFAVNE